jgi:mitochondrial fission protein ELM1
MPANPIRVLWLKDNRPGHVNKVKGFLASLGRLAPLSVTPCDVRWRYTPLRHLVGRLSRTRWNLPPGLLFRDLNPGTAFDLVISSGGLTQWPNVLLARRIGVPNIYIGSPHHFPPELFTLIPMTDPPHGNPPFLKLELTPSEVTPDAARACAAKQFPELRERGWTLLLGGDGEGMRWSDADFLDLAARFRAAASKAGRRMYVSTSRRTRPAVERELIAQFEGAEGFACGAWFHASGGKTLPLLALLGAAERIVVTADSVSMTNEAVAAGVPAVAVYPTAGAPNRRHEAQFSLLEQEGRLARWRLAKDADLAELHPSDGWRLITTDLHRACAETALRRLGLLPEGGTCPP